MANPEPPLQCYIAGCKNDRMDPYFEEHGFSRGLILFAIPSLGILFRCRAEGEPVALEFGAFFSLLRFVKTRLKQENITRVAVFSSSPEFVFSFAGHSRHIPVGSSREKMIREYSKDFKIGVAFIEAHKNQSQIPSADFPSVPRDRKPVLAPGEEELREPEFKPIQKGIRI